MLTSDKPPKMDLPKVGCGLVNQLLGGASRTFQGKRIEDRWPVTSRFSQPRPPLQDLKLRVRSIAQQQTPAQNNRTVRNPVQYGPCLRPGG